MLLFAFFFAAADADMPPLSDMLLRSDMSLLPLLDYA